MKIQEQILKLNKDKNVLCYSLGDFYDSYAEDRKSIDHLSRKKFLICVKKIFKYIALEMIQTVRPYNPKVGLGRFGIIKSLSKKKSIDWKLTKQYGKVIYHKNNHTNGAIFRWHWEKQSKCFFKNKKFYSFKMVRSLERELGQHIFRLEKDPLLKPFDALTQLPPYEN